MLKKRALDWYSIRDYDLGDERNDELVTDFPRDGDCVLVLFLSPDATASIKFDSPNSDSFEFPESRRLRHNFSNLYLTNTEQTDKTLRLLFGRGDWEIERHHPEEEIVITNADTVDHLHASASIEANKLLALGADKMFPDGAVRNIQSEIEANLPGSPVAGDIFIATDTGKVYFCYTAGIWTEIPTSLTFNANTILAANLDNTPAALTVAEQTLLGRITGGNIAALTALQIKVLLFGAVNQGDILYDNGTSLVRLPPGTSGHFLKTQGAGADPVWAAVPGVPSGVILMWWGTIATIPSGWFLCNGGNGTPDLRDRFILSVGVAEDPGGTGGSNTHTHAKGTLAADSGGSHPHSITGSTAAGSSHTHSGGSLGHHAGITSRIVVGSQGSWRWQVLDGGDDKRVTFYAWYGATGGESAHTHGKGTLAASSGGSHPHTISGTTAAGDNVPVYFKLAFIMKS